MGIWSPGPGATSGGDTFTGDATGETADGLAGNDTLNGNDGADTLTGGAGLDHLFGGEGDDILHVGAADFEGGETLSGGNGTDTIVVDGGSTNLNLDFAIVSSIERVTFSGIGPNSFVTFDAAQIGPGISSTLLITGSATGDLFQITMAAPGTLTLAGFTFSNWGGSDTVRIFGSGSADTITGSSQTNYIYGGGGGDTINAGAAGGVAAGEAGDDVLNGGAGNDVMIGGFGADNMHGAGGDDQFNFGEGEIQSGDIVDGGTQGSFGDSIYVYGDSSFQEFDLRLITISGIETIYFGSSTGNVSIELDASQLSGFASNLAIWGSTSVDGLTVFNNGATANYSVAGWQFFSWDPSELLGLVGTNAANTIVGSSVSDSFVGLDGNDVFTGGAGNDIVYGGGGRDQANYAVSSIGVTFTRAVDGSWTFAAGGSEGTDTVYSTEILHFSDRDVHLDAAENAFNGNGTSDILFRRADGLMATWEVTGTTINGATFLATAPGPTWALIGTGDIDGDGREDILWQRNDGLVYAWLMNGTISSAQAIAGIGAGWTYLGAGDFNGDSYDDLAWQRSDGLVYLWNMQTGAISSAAAVTGLPAVWEMQGIGDFNSDGRDDFLWRRSDTGETVIWIMNGSAIQVSGATTVQAGLEWEVAGVGDVNADGRDDIIMHRTTDGQVRVWFMDSGTVTSNHVVGSANPANWELVTVGDYNGDGRDDLLWQRADGVVFTWLLNAAGNIASSGTLSGLDASWDVIPGG
ncbi:FG-GAP-like repeat-containing protein [Terricaulis sp.]|uniref:calcium-binding protein n=1 Tax=Terricaulis sp. TaxID=2768686 RepID=UPI0037842E8E